VILLNLVQQSGIIPKRVAGTGGGEYHSPCPACKGTDRFVIQPHKQMKNCIGYYFCRQCGIKGDSIQFCLDHLGFTSFKEAANYVGANIRDQPQNIFAQQKNKPAATIINKPSAEWKQQAYTLVQEAHEYLLLQKDILQMLHKRGLPIEAIKRYKIGWLPEDKSFEGHIWGLERETIWFPAGILIPTMDQDQTVIRLKVRRSYWYMGDKLPKYIAIPGNMHGLNIIGNKKNSIIIVVESELDAYALHYAVGDFAVIVAIGGCAKNPDPVTEYLAKNKTVLLVCHDNDEAGKEMLRKWQLLYPHAKGYTTPIGKDIGEAMEQGLDIRTWILTIVIQAQGWNASDQELLQWVFKYISERTSTRDAYVKYEQEILLGLDSPRAKTGELQDGFRLMKQMLEEYTNLQRVT
jgi:DNA primase